MSDYVFGCPKCNREFRIQPEFAGEVMQCPHCSQKMRIPANYFVPEADSADSRSVETPQDIQAAAPKSKQQTQIDSQRGSPQETHVKQTTAKRERPDKTTSATTQTNQASAEPRTTRSDHPAAPSKAGAAAGSKQPAPLSGSNKTPEHADSEKRASKPGAQLPPQFVASEPSQSSAKRVPANQSSSSDQSPPASVNASSESGPQAARIASKEAGQPPSATGTEGKRKPFSEESAPSKTEELRPKAGPESATKSEATESDSATEPTPATELEPESASNIAHLFPPQFAVLDPSRFRRQSSFENQVLLPTADGGVQTVSERWVTIEYKGEKYVVVAMSPAEKRRRQIIANVFSVVVAIVAIVGTIWILMQ